VRLVDKLFVVRLYQMDKSSLKDHADKIRRVLCDRDPCVMGASLPLLHDLVKDDVAAYKDLVPSLVSILKQIVEHRLPREFDYHRIPAPWIQMSILRILALLGRGDQASSEGMYEVLVDVMRRADTGINVGYAIVYQTVHTVTTIYPNTLLLDAAATSISRFIRSDSHNLKYIGIKGLASIVRCRSSAGCDRLFGRSG
jgi:AP-4 complex subunit epsilon-1